MSFMAITILSIVMVVILVINGVELSSTMLVLSNTAFMSIVISAIVVYSLIAVLFYFLTKRAINKGVNVD